MKRVKALLLLCLFAGSVSLVSCKDSDRTIGFDRLPETARQFIEANFNRNDIMTITRDNDSYDVVFSATELEFDRAGQWTSVEGDIPSGVLATLPQSLRDYVASSYPGRHIVKVEKNLTRYDVELSDRTDLEFDLKGKFIRVDR